MLDLSQAYPKLNAKGVRLRAKFLAPRPSAAPFSVAHKWADFFTALLMNPLSFMWAKQFLSSSAMSILNDQDAPPMPFMLPDCCPFAVPCLKDLEVNEDFSALEELLSNPLIKKEMGKLLLSLAPKAHQLNFPSTRSLNQQDPSPSPFFTRLTKPKLQKF
jgi:hypothetical protein